tara:strand:+ start:10510 stop:10995 length:486 start_codon:yes stop_codon:yes gene_type:complete
MGLDMYLDKHHYYGGKYKTHDHEKEYWRHSLEVKGKFAEENGLSENNISEIVQNVAYWRKANAIHGWFVTNVQEGNDNCQQHWCTSDQLKTLLMTCKEVIKALDDKNYAKAEGLLPPTEGCFFGQYDVKHNWYREEIEETISQLTEALKLPGESFYYTSSW